MGIDTLGKIVRVTIAATYADKQVQENNLAYKCTVAGGADTRRALAAAVQGHYNTRYVPKMATTTQVYGYNVTTLMPRPIDPGVSLASANVGTGTGVVMPTQVRPVLTWSTALGGRGGRGRLYLFTPDSSQQDAATFFPIAGLTTAINLLAADLYAPIVVGGSTWELQIAHRIPGVPPAPSTYSTIPVTGGVGSERFGTIRKSGNYGKTNLNPW